MKKVLDIAAKVLLSLLMISPILGALGIFPPPTRELYNTDLGFAFIDMLFQSGYIIYVMAVVFLIALITLWTKREALAALLILPLTVNIIGFHAFVDGGLFNAGSIMADLLVILNVYFLYQNRNAYKPLLAPRK